MMPSQMGDLQAQIPEGGMQPPQQGGMPANMPQGQPSGMSPEGEPGGMPEFEGGMMESPEQESQEDFESIVDYALRDTNLARSIRKKKDENDKSILEEMGAKVVKGYEDDEESRREWMRQYKEWLKLALLVRETKTYPWPKASNVKYPLLATAAMQFSARAYPALVPSDGKVVKSKVIPYDPSGNLSKKAQNIARHMSYQVMCKIPNWEEEMDKLLMTVAISGLCFKKTYYDSFEKKIQSKIIYPEDLCVNYWATSIESAYRKTEILHFTDNQILEKVNNNEEFLDLDFGDPTTDVLSDMEMKSVATGVMAPPEHDKSTPHVFLCQHTFWDLDEDGYEEPYVITVHKKTKQVVRIVARWESKGFHTDERGKVVKIDPIEYFTAFPFIPNPDGSIYALGFGLLLGPINEAVNSNINQLTDAGTINNLQSGFIGKGLRLKMGMTSFQPGEWKLVNATGDDLHKQIVPLPSKEPSSVLMALLQLLITSGNQLASIAEIMVGKMPGQNTPATTTQETVKQGMAVFTAIYKRIYRSLASEFSKIYFINRITPNIVQEESKVLGMNLAASDYDDDDLIIPGGDPTGDSESTKAQKVQQVGQMLQLGTVDPMAFTIWAMEVQEIPNYQKLLKQPQPAQPDPKVMALQQKAKLDEQKAASDIQVKEQQARIDAMMKQMEMEFKARLAEIEQQAAEDKLNLDRQRQAMELQGEQAKMNMNMVAQTREHQFAARKQQQDFMHSELAGRQKLAHAEASNKQKLEMAKQQPKAGGNKKK